MAAQTVVTGADSGAGTGSGIVRTVQCAGCRALPVTGKELAL